MRKYTPEEKVPIVLEGFCREAAARDPSRWEGSRPMIIFLGAFILLLCISAPITVALGGCSLVYALIG